jgi:hypothetical protein
MSNFLLLILLIWLSPTSVFSESTISHAVKLPPPAFKIEHTRSNPNRPTRPHGEKYKGPIIDTLVHIFPPRDPNFDESKLKKIVEVIKKSNVEVAVFSPTPNDGRRRNYEYLAYLRKRLKDLDTNRIKLFCGSDYISYWLHRSHRNGYTETELQQILNRLRKDIDSSLFAGIGEIGLYHFDKTGRQPVIAFPPNFAPFVRIVDLIAKKRTWLYLHAEPVRPDGMSYEEMVFGGVELLFRRNPDLKLILSHTAMTNPVNVRRMLIRYSNLKMNLKIINQPENWKHLEVITNPQGELYQDWAQLFEEMPERFIVGTDAKFFRREFNTSNYKKRIKRLRLILGRLDEKAARLIAYENAQKLFK